MTLFSSCHVFYIAAVEVQKHLQNVMAVKMFAMKFVPSFFIITSAREREGQNGLRSVQELNAGQIERPQLTGRGRSLVGDCQALLVSHQKAETENICF